MLIQMLGMARSGFAKHASMRDALQAVDNMPEVFGQISDYASLGDGEHSRASVLDAHV